MKINQFDGGSGGGGGKKGKGAKGAAKKPAFKVTTSGGLSKAQKSLKKNPFRK